MLVKHLFYCLLTFICLGIYGGPKCEAIQDASANARDSFLHNGVTAHRGNSSEFPENSMAAFKNALALGVDWIELDIFRSADGKLVVSHDRRTGRVAEQDLDVTETPYSELAQLDIAFKLRQARGVSLEACPKAQMPLLEDVLKLIKQQTKSRVSIQPKMACVPEAIELIRHLKCEPWCGFNDGNLEWMTQVKQLVPELPVFWDRPPHADLDADIKTAQERGFESLVLHHSLINTEIVTQVKAAGLEVGAWTVNDLTTLQRFKKMGVDRIYTDHPRELLTLQNYNLLDGVICEGKYPKHLQGVCLGDDQTIYWSFTTELVHTDFAGKVLKKIPVADHHGDLCFVDGKIYVAVNLGKFNDPAGNAQNWIIAYDAASLQEAARYPIPEVFHGAGGIAHHGSKFIVVGGLAPGIQENYLYEYDQSFRFQKRHTLSTGYTLMGIQTAAFAHDRWWFGCYGEPKTLITTGPDFQDIKHVTFDASLGIVGIDSGRLIIASGNCASKAGCDGKLRMILTDEIIKAAPVPTLK